MVRHDISFDSLIKDLSCVFQLPNMNNHIREFLSDPLYLEIINTSWFRRLFRIPFLGGLSYIESNDKTNTRGHHSLGVGLLAYYYSMINNLEKRTERIWVISGLLHDIHHLPFSHTMEYALKRETSSFSPHDLNLKIIFEKNADVNGKSISDIAKRYDIDIENDAFFLKPNDERHVLLRSTHNLDTLEGITRANVRCFRTTEKKYCALPKKIIEATSISNVSEFSHSDIETFDLFWKIKDAVYTQGIYDSRKVFFEIILSFYLYDFCNENDLLDKLYYLTDEDIFRKCPCLRSTIKLLWIYINTSNKNVSKSIRLHTDKKPRIISKSHRLPLKYSMTARQFKINNTMYREFDKKINSRNRYHISNYCSTLSLDPNAVDNIEEIIAQPIRKRLEKLVY